MTHWALDLGTTNTSLARWDDETDRPVLVVLADICRDPTDDDPTHAPDSIPTATEMVAGTDLLTWVGRLPWFQTHTLLGRRAYIGRQALSRNLTRVKPSFARTFKPYLQHQALKPIANLGRTRFTARDVAQTYLRELLSEVQRSTGRKVERITITSPVDAYEGYRAELRRMFQSFGVEVARFVDEPVAAAVGYGISVRDTRRVLVVDSGGGTTDLALVEIDGHTVRSGRARVLGKSGRSVAGDVVDRWVLQRVCEQLGARLPDDAFWEQLLLDEARALKERLFVQDEGMFHLRPPEHGAGNVRLIGANREVVLRREDLVDILEHRGFYDLLETITDEVVGPHPPPDDVLLVGGSTLLPGVFPYFERRFGRDRVRGWQPFHAVAAGACTFAARGFIPTDHVVHAYAIQLHDPRTGAKQFETVIPAGTPFPTPPDLWHRQLRPICPLGEPERLYKLVVCEIGRAPESERSFGWDDAGRLHRLEAGQRLVVPLNESDPTLGVLDPPHQPGDPTPRLDVRFGVDADRWLIANVVDLRTGRVLLRDKPVVRLL